MAQIKSEQLPTYTDLGFSSFLEKPMANPVGLGSSQPVGGYSGQLNFDSTQMSGSLGDKIQVGNIIIDGTEGRIVVNDGNVDRVIIGRIG